MPSSEGMLPTVDVGRWHMMGAVTAMMIVLGAVAYGLGPPQGFCIPVHAVTGSMTYRFSLDDGGFQTNS